MRKVTWIFTFVFVLLLLQFAYPETDVCFVLSGDKIENINVIRHSDGLSTVSIQLTSTGTGELARFTAKRMNQRVKTVINNRILNNLTVHAVVTSGMIGLFSMKDDEVATLFCDILKTSHTTIDGKMISGAKWIIKRTSK